MSLFANALQSNIVIPLETIDLSKNALDDKKGFVTLSSLISRVSTLRSLTLSECIISEKCVNLVASGLLQALKPNTGAQQLHLVAIDFSGNPLKDEMNDLQQLLSICTSLRSINLSDTGFNLDKLWPSLKFGGLQLETLNLAGCQSGRRNKDNVQNIKEYFSTAVALKHINFADTVMCSDLLKALLLGLASNQQLKPYTLILDNVCERGCSSVLETCIGGVDASHLSLRDNALEAEALSVIASASHMPHLKRLDLSGTNFTNLRRSAKHAATLNNILLEVVKLIGEEDSQLNELVLSDCRLSSHLSVLLNTLGVASSLLYLDITGNEMGNFGARLLAKALQINVSLKTILIDRNQITGDGFADIAHALKLNNTLTSMPYPLIDVADSLNRPDRAKTLAALSDIEVSLEKNRRGEGRGQAYYRLAISALQQEFMGRSGNGNDHLSDLCDKLGVALGTLISDENSSQHSMFNLIDEALNKLESCNTQFVKEALGPIKRIADAEGLDVRVPPPIDNNLAARRTLINQIADYLCELKWKGTNAAIESVILDFRTQFNTDDKRSIGSWQNKNDRSPVVDKSDSFSRSTQKSSHRPKSVVTDLCNGESIEEKVSFELPPTTSALNHISKTRPKPARKTNQIHRRAMARAVEESMDSAMCASSECDDNSAVYDIAADERLSSPEFSTGQQTEVAPVDVRYVPSSSSPASVYPSNRPALLPPSTVLTPPPPHHQSQLSTIASAISVPVSLPNTTQSPLTQSSPRSSVTLTQQQSINTSNGMASSNAPQTTSQTHPQPVVLSSSPSSSTAPPPIVPRRNRVGPALTPPSLPPKPESVHVRPASCAIEDENANSRRSVADMARMFSSSETPFVRRT